MNTYKRHRFPPEIISYAVWLYYRFNQSAEQTFGYRAQEIMGESVEILLPEQFRRNHSKYVEDFTGKSSPSRSMNERADIVGQKKDGATFPARASISRMKRDGRITLTVFLRDVSEIRRVEQEVRRTRDELAHVNRISLLGEISASLAHELNQPLAAILTNAQVLKREIEANPMSLEGADETITDVIQDTRRAAEVINRLRALLKPKERLVEVVDINQIVAGATDLLSSEIVIRQASLTLELAPDLPAVFEPFYTTKERGMGMGLAISRTMLQTHGGRLWAENNRGPGTTFYFTLPVADGADAIATARQADEPNEDRSDVATVFIVDDDPSVRQAMGRLIGSAGYAVEAFASAQAFLQRERYDGIGCLVVDLHMPGETGLDLQTTLNTRD